MNYGFIGAGNMAISIIRGLIKNNQDISKNIFVFDVNSDSLNRCVDELNVNKASTNEILISNCDVVVLAVKPKILTLILPDLSKAFYQKNPLIISIAAGKEIKTIEHYLGFKGRICRIMPNINVEVLESMSAICYNCNVTDEDIEITKNIFGSIGKVEEIKEELFSVFSGIAGCSPAFTYIYIDSLAKAALKSGFDKKTALKIVAQSVLGSAKMVLESDLHPLDLVDKVCSPGGTTIEGVCVLDEHSFPSILVKAVDKTIEKDELLKKEKEKEKEKRKH